MQVIVDMIRGSVDGEKHETALKAGKLAGGYIATGLLDEHKVLTIAESEFSLKNVKSLKAAVDTFKDGIEYGKSMPIEDLKTIEKSKKLIKNDKGQYDFIADEEKMDDYEQAVINGTLEMGKPFNLGKLDEHFVYKDNTMVFFIGLDNVGKSTVVWYKSVVLAAYYDIKFVLYSAENTDGTVRRKIKEFYIGKSIKDMSAAEREKAQVFYKKHYRIFTSEKGYKWDEIILRAEIIKDEGFDYDCFIVEPYNAMLDSSSKNDETAQTLNKLRVFKETYASVWVCDHVITDAARNIDSDGNVKRPYKSHASGGQMKANKTDDFVVIHRNVKSKQEWMNTEIHVDKIKETETGGYPTPNDDPPVIRMRPDKCGFEAITFGGGSISFDKVVDPMKDYWARINGVEVDNTIPESDNSVLEGAREIEPIVGEDGMGVDDDLFDGDDESFI